MVIKFAMEIICDDIEPSQYVHLYHGEIFGHDDSDDDGEIGEPDIKMGEVDVYLVDRVRVMNERESLFDAMDATSHEMMECYEAIIDQETNDWKDEVESLIGEDALMAYNILFIDRLELEPQFRGKGIGKQVAQDVIKALGSNCGVIVCKPFPLQYQGYGDPEKAHERAEPGYEEKRLDAFRKAVRFWESLGFRKLPSSNFYLWADERVRNKRSRCRQPGSANI